MNYQNKKLWVAVDCLVFGYDTQSSSISFLAFKRKVDPFSGQWSLIGEMVDEGEDTDESARRVLNKFTGLDDVYLEQLTVFGKAGRDPVGRVVSLLYWSLIKLDEPRIERVHQFGAEWFDFASAPQLVLDHNEMLEFGKTELIKTARNTPIGFELMPEKFTLPQLLKLYESIYNQELDDRNFRKKMLSSGLLKKLEEKDKSTSKKGAFLYKFDRTAYTQLTKDGFHLDLI